MSTRKILSIRRSVPTIEGAGVHLRRAFGFGIEPRTDPFLLLDDFRSDRRADFEAGFPWHPHRGIETITYVLAGEVSHGDSLGNSGRIGPGDVQWMTAGSGIVHQEMPHGDSRGRMYGFQLWANLPASHKMMEPRYRDVAAAAIPTVQTPGGAIVKVIAGQVGDVAGPVCDVITSPEYLDVAVPAGCNFRHATSEGHSLFAYVFEGEAYFGGDAGGQPSAAPVGDATLVVFGDGDHVIVGAASAATRLLLVSGRPLNEPVAWKGPIVMNTDEEIRIAFSELRNDTFLKHELRTKGR